MTDEKKYPEVVVAAVIYNDKNEILLTKASKWGDYWQIPGGHVELGETCEEALKREILEETGLEIDNIEFDTMQDSVYPKEFERKAHFVMLDYRASLSGGKMAEKNREMHEYKWLRPEVALKELKLNPYTEKSVKNFLEKTNKDYKGLYKRALADYQNLLKQTAKEKMEFAVYANEHMLKEILPVYDHLKMSLEHHNGETTDNWLQGVKHVVKQFKDVLKKIGVEEIKTAGEKFDHNNMDAVKNEDTDDESLDGQVAKQVKAGYMLNGKVIEPAKVIVYKFNN
jgi:nucleoside triphosphatase